MFSPESIALILTAFTIGSLHTIMGPDHYVPFIMMSKSGEWNLKRTVLITSLCGLGHVMSSVVLGLIGVAFGIGISKLELFEGVRGGMAAWALMAFGLVYAAWGFRRAMQGRSHTHTHSHDGVEHDHTHDHHQDHAHTHPKPNRTAYSTWALFLVFVLGPCEPLIPILMYPAAKKSWMVLIAVTVVFAVTTIATMLGAVLAARYGLSFVPWKKIEKYTATIAGLSIFLCGGAIQFLGL